MEKPQKGDVWRHYKTKGEYEVVGIGRMQVKSEALDMKECVIYRALADGNLWCRPLEDFLEPVVTDTDESVARFHKVS